jgi:hypothetical protein
MLGDLSAGSRITLGADKAHDTVDFVAGMRRRRSAIDRRTTRHAGWRVNRGGTRMDVSQRKRRTHV